MKPLILSAAAIALACGAHAQTCPVFPPDNIWNTRIDQLPVHPSSSTWVNTIGPTAFLHPDFGSGTYNGGPIGIPFVRVPGTQPKYPASFLYQRESDFGPYAIPLNAPVEGGSAGTGDRHTIAIDTANCVLYEIYRAFPQATSWKGDSGAIFSLGSNQLRPETWTSADAAGLPVFAGLVRYDEILVGEIRHALRFTAPRTRRGYVWPARHFASSRTGAEFPPMGARFRLKASFDISKFSPTNQIILTALKRYGMMIADNGSAWYLSGAPDARWNDSELRALRTIGGSNFEAVDATTLMITPHSGQARQTSVFAEVAPVSAAVTVNGKLPFTAKVSGDTNQAVIWDVNGTVGGYGAVGFIDSISGLYTAPAAVPTPATVTVRATSRGGSGAAGSATVTILPAVTVTISPTGVSLRPAATRQFRATVRNTANTAVVWKVNGIAGGNAVVGTVSATGIYTAPSQAAAGTILSVSATSAADPSKMAAAAVTLLAASSR